MGNKKSAPNDSKQGLVKSTSLLAMPFTPRKHSLSSASGSAAASMITGTGVHVIGKIPGFKDFAQYSALASLNNFLKPNIQLVNSLNTTFVIDQENVLYAFGYQQQGEFGVGSSSSATALEPVKVKIDDKKVKQVAAGYRHILAITTEHKLYSWGEHTRCLGIDDTADPSFPTKVKALKKDNIVLIAAGFEHSIAYTESKKFYIWGNNNHNQLPFPKSIKHLDEPTEVEALTGKTITAIYSHAYSTIVVTDDLHYFAFGNNDNGVLGSGDMVSTGEVVEIKALQGIKFSKICMSRSHVIGLTTGQEIYTWGANSFSQLGFASQDAHVPSPHKLPFSLVKDVAASENCSSYISNENECVFFGKELMGEAVKKTPSIPQQLERVKVSNVWMAHGRSCIIVSEVLPVLNDMPAAPRRGSAPTVVNSK